jgi:hypothetical protein
MNLDGTDITVLKAIGLSGGDSSGEDILSRASGLDEAEVLDAIQGLLALGYVLGDVGGAIRSVDELKRGKFSVNSGYVKEIREAVDPRAARDKKPQRRQRRA